MGDPSHAGFTTQSSRLWGQRSYCPQLVLGKLTAKLWAPSPGHMVRVCPAEALSHSGSPFLRQWDSGQQSGLSSALPAGLLSGEAALPEACLLGLVADCGVGMSISSHKGSSEKAGCLACRWVARVFPEGSTSFRWPFVGMPARVSVSDVRTAEPTSAALWKLQEKQASCFHSCLYRMSFGYLDAQYCVLRSE